MFLYDFAREHLMFKPDVELNEIEISKLKEIEDLFNHPISETRKFIRSISESPDFCKKVNEYLKHPSLHFLYEEYLENKKKEQEKEEEEEKRITLYMRKIKEQEKKPKPPPHIYFIKSSSNSIKIGITNNIERRIEQIQKTSGFILSVEGIIPYGGYDKEQELHELFNQYRIGNEWFIYSDEIKKYISQNTKQYNRKIDSL